MNLDIIIRKGRMGRIMKVYAFPCYRHTQRLLRWQSMVKAEPQRHCRLTSNNRVQRRERTSTGPQRNRTAMTKSLARQNHNPKKANLNTCTKCSSAIMVDGVWLTTSTTETHIGTVELLNPERVYLLLRFMGQSHRRHSLPAQTLGSLEVLCTEIEVTSSNRLACSDKCLPARTMTGLETSEGKSN